MKRTLTSLTITLALLAMPALLLAPAAQATPDPIAVAQTAWSGSPCTNRIRVYWDHGITAYGFVGVASGIQVNPGGTWQRISCDVVLDPVYWGHNGYYERLAVILHEAGHLSGGPGHLTVGIMTPDHHACWPLCYLFPSYWTQY